MNQDDFTQLLDAEDPITLYARRKRVMGSIFAYLVILGVIVANGEMAHLFLALVIFILLAMSIAKMFNPELHTLVINEKGFELRDLISRTFYSWEHHDHFATRANGQVVFDYSGPAKPLAQKITAFNKQFIGYDRSFINRYDITTGQLVQLLNHRRQRAMKP